jgi:hypothetical protein
MMMTVHEVIELAKELVKAPNLLPKHARTVPEILAIVLAGQELSFGPMASLRNFQLVSGKLTMTADTMLAQMVKAGIQIAWEKDGSDGEAVLKLKRGSMTHAQKFSAEDQKRAGLNSDTWRKFGPAMLRARCVSAAVRAFAPDVLGGTYIPGELPDDDRSEGPASDALVEAHETKLAAAKISKLSSSAQNVIDLASAQGFTPASEAAVSPEVETSEELAHWMRGQLDKGLDKSSKATVWSVLQTRCAELGLNADDILRAAKNG